MEGNENKINLNNNQNQTLNTQRESQESSSWFGYIFKYFSRNKLYIFGSVFVISLLSFCFIKSSSFIYSPIIPFKNHITSPLCRSSNDKPQKILLPSKIQKKMAQIKFQKSKKKSKIDDLENVAGPSNSTTQQSLSHSSNNIETLKCCLGACKISTIVETPVDIEEIGIYDKLYGFSRQDLLSVEEEVSTNQIKGTLPFYEKHIFIGDGENAFLKWSNDLHFASEEFSSLFFESSLVIKKELGESGIKCMINACDEPRGDVLVFTIHPIEEQYTKTRFKFGEIAFEDLTLQLLFDFWRYILNNDLVAYERSLQEIPFEECADDFIMVCCHQNHSRYCGFCGPSIIETFNDEIIRFNLHDIRVISCSHIGSCNQSANVIIFHERWSSIPPSRSESWKQSILPYSPETTGSKRKSYFNSQYSTPMTLIMGDHYSYISPPLVSTLVTSHFIDDDIHPRVHRHWKGAMGLQSIEWVYPNCRLNIYGNCKVCQNLKILLNEETSNKIHYENKTPTRLLHRRRSVRTNNNNNGHQVLDLTTPVLSSIQSKTGVKKKSTKLSTRRHSLNSKDLSMISPGLPFIL